MNKSPSKKRSPRFPPLDDPREWVYFDWEHSIIIRHLERSVAKSIEFAMPDEFKIENGCKIRRLDTGEVIDSPLSVCRFTVSPKLVYLDFFDTRQFVEVACEITPAAKKPKPKTKSPAKLLQLTNSATSVKSEKVKPSSAKKPGLLF